MERTEREEFQRKTQVASHHHTSSMMAKVFNKWHISLPACVCVFGMSDTLDTSVSEEYECVGWLWYSMCVCYGVYVCACALCVCYGVYVCVCMYVCVLWHVCMCMRVCVMVCNGMVCV